jgi:hypothetical protein
MIAMGTSPKPSRARFRRSRIVAGVVVLVIVIAAVAGSKHNGTPNYRIDVTAVVPYTSKTVGVAFNVENVGTATGTPVCTVIAAASSTDGGVNDPNLDSIKPRHFDYVAAPSDIVTLSGGDAAAAKLPGGTSVKCQ